MTSTIHDILGPDGAIARRLGEKYEHRAQQLEMASAVHTAFMESTTSSSKPAPVSVKVLRIWFPPSIGP